MVSSDTEKLVAVVMERFMLRPLGPWQRFRSVRIHKPIEIEERPAQFVHRLAETGVELEDRPVAILLHDLRQLQHALLQVFQLRLLQLVPKIQAFSLQVEQSFQLIQEDLET